MNRPKISKKQFIIHLLCLLAAWGLFFLGLFTVWVSTKDVYELVAIVLMVEICLLLLTTISWLKYHLFLHRTKGQRKGVTPAKWEYSRDWSGYEVIMDESYIKEAKFIIIDCDDTNKIKRYSFPDKGSVL